MTDARTDDFLDDLLGAQFWLKAVTGTEPSMQQCLAYVNAE